MTNISIQSFGFDDKCKEAFYYLRSMQSPGAKSPPFPDDGRAYLLMHRDEPRAFVATFASDTMLNTAKNTAILGFYEALNEQDGLTLLAHVENHMRDAGIEALIGPMNQNTWGQYRFALPVEKDDHLFSPHSFLGDVVNHESYPRHFTNFGFRPISYYESRASFNLSGRHARRREIAKALKDHGITIGAIDMARFDETLKDIFSLSLQGFSNNKFYAPIEFDYFASLYKGISSIIDPDFFLLARNKKDALVGFIFSYQDPMAKEKRVILKTMTIDKSVRGMGLGLFLMEETQRIAHEKNFDMAIHALMYIDNTTKGISEGGLGSKLFRRYALYGKSI